jgi:hypothetical protein
VSLPLKTSRYDLARSKAKLATMIGPGFITPPFSALVLGLEAPTSRR